MRTPGPDEYLQLFARAMPDPAATAHHLGGIITLLQSAKAALRDNQPENAKRAEAALTVALGALSGVCLQFDKTAEWLASNSWADAARHLM